MNVQIAENGQKPMLPKLYFFGFLFTPGPTGSSVKCPLPSVHKLSSAQTLFSAQAKHSSDISNTFEPKPSLVTEPSQPVQTF